MDNQPSPIAPVTKHVDESLAEIELIPASQEQEAVLANLLELYIHDFSEFHHASEIGEDGRFGYTPLAQYWHDPARLAFLIRTAGKLAGFAFVIRGTGASAGDPAWDIAEFFILRRYRRRGFGTRVAHQLFRLLPGRWEVRVMESNRPAQRFWAHAISLFLGEAADPLSIQRDGLCWQIFSFDTRHLE